MTAEKWSDGLAVYPLVPERWADLEALFGSRGACAGCWCMYWRQTQREFEAGAGEPNRFALRKLIETGVVPGLLAYHDGKAIGWISLGPRESFPRLARSRVLKPVDDNKVWSVVCFFVAKEYRRQGLMVYLLQEGVRFAASCGAEIVEGYPIAVKSGNTPAVFIYTGTESAFLQAGFVEVARRSETRPIMRYSIKK